MSLFEYVVRITVLHELDKSRLAFGILRIVAKIHIREIVLDCGTVEIIFAHDNGSRRRGWLTCLLHYQPRRDYRDEEER